MVTNWVVQSNLLNDVDASLIENACKRHGHVYTPVKVIPFSETLPNIANDMPTVFYGGTNWINAIHKSGVWRPGTFFDEEKFLISKTLEMYQHYALNYGGVITTLGNVDDTLQMILEKNDSSVFIRPERDLKQFHGNVIDLGDLDDWVSRVRMQDGTVTSNTNVLIAKPVGISSEWRCFMGRRRVMAASRYREYGVLSVDAHVPQRVIEFAEAMATIWTPSDVFTLDVGESNGVLYIIENNCFNSSGFYACDVEKIIKDVSWIAESLYTTQNERRS